MTFLNALLALGTAAFSIPLIIHLLNRSRYLTIDWGAMHLLDTSIRVNARRIQWKQWLLLLIRCMIPVVLALAMARPMVLSWKDSGVANAMALVVLLDDSMSMQSVDGSQQVPPLTRWQRACDGLTQIAGQLPTGSSIHLILSGTPPESHPDLDVGAFKELLQQLRIRTDSAGRLELSAAAELGIQWLSRSTLVKRHVMVVSDFESSDWGPENEASRRELQQELTQGSNPISSSWVDIGLTTIPEQTSAQSSAMGGVSVKAMEITPRYASEGSPLTITATLQNYSEVSVQVPVALFADVDEIERQSISIQPRSSVTCRFRWIPKRAGDAVLSIRAEYDDETVMDSSIDRVMRIQNAIRVLLVDGARRAEAMKSESDFLRVALTPFALLEGQPGDLFSTRVVDPSGWDEAMLKEYEVVVLCNVPDLARERLEWLRAFAEDGGGVVVALGDSIQIERYNTWQSIVQGGLRPGTLMTNKEWKGNASVTETPFFDLPPQVIESMNSIQLQNRLTLADVVPNGWTGFRFDDGEPWMIAYSIGAGRCVWMLSSCDDGDSNFPARPAYLPLMQRLMLFADQTPAGLRWMEPGQTWVEQWEASDVGSPIVSVEWNRVGEASNTLPVESTERLSPAHALVESRISLPRLTGIVQGRVGSQVRKMMVDISPVDRNRELTRDRLSASGFEALAQQSGAMPFTTVDEWMGQMRSRWSGRELWLWLWLLLIALVFAEMALQQSFRVRATGAAERPQRESSTPRTSRGVV